MQEDRIEKIKRDFFNRCKAFLIRKYKPVDGDGSKPYILSTYSIFQTVQSNHPSRLYKEIEVERWLQELNFKKGEMPGSASKYWQVKNPYNNKLR